ncbi:hypothetical protein MMC26_002497 [Xylographa opegraphella]|nr:hypothetical protein [Xylographa opegraphella]
MARPKSKQPIFTSNGGSEKGSVPLATATPPRQSKRVKTSLSSTSTPKKSPYFEAESSSSEPNSEIENEASGYEDEDESAVSAVSSPPESEEEIEEANQTSEDEKPRKRKRGRPSAASVATVKATKGKELWRPGVKVDLAPGEQVFIKLPKARQPGKTPYADDTIHPNTMLFLADLKENNDREWLKVHDADYRQSKLDFDSFVECLTEKIIEKDETIPELPPKDLTFRIYRDIRFSPDPTPYKPYFSAAWSRTGRKGPYAHYYVQIQPGGSFVGAGIWHPEAEPLRLLRRAVDRKAHKLKTVLMEPRIRKECLGGVGSNEKKVVKAFCASNAENSLKNKPKGYEADNPNIELLRLRNYTMGRKLKDDEVVGTKGITRIAEIVGIMSPFVAFLNSVVMPDGEQDSSDEEEEEAEEEDEAEQSGE